jgi:hypothetical protein
VSITLQKSLYELTFGGNQVGSRDLGAAPGLSGRGRALPRGKLAARRSPPGRKPRVSAHSGYGRSAGANFPTISVHCDVFWADPSDAKTTIGPGPR